MLANLKMALAAREMLQADLADSLKIGTSLLSEVVCGRRRADAALRTRIASELSADESWLFSEFARIPGFARHDVNANSAREVSEAVVT